MKRTKTFAEIDDTLGWEKDASDTRDHRICKYLREHQRAITLVPLADQFMAGRDVILPKIVLIDVDETTSTAEVKGPASIVREDVYEAFWRTDYLTIRGIFANGEPIWGEVQYNNGMSFIGGLNGGRPHGFGVKRMATSVYKGVFENGDRHGKGILVNAKDFTLYAGCFVKDKPHGVLLRITFVWDKTKGNVQHNRSLVRFEHGTIVTEEKARPVNVSMMSGLAPEEFLQMYREGEKSLEDSMILDALRKTSIDPILLEPVGI
jgi:hypothetical protein